MRDIYVRFLFRANLQEPAETRAFVVRNVPTEDAFKLWFSATHTDKTTRVQEVRDAKSFDGVPSFTFNWLLRQRAERRQLS